MEVVCCDFELAIDLFDFGLCIADVIKKPPKGGFFFCGLIFDLALFLMHEEYILQENKNALLD